MAEIKNPPGAYEDISLGDFHERTILVSEELVGSFARLTGDLNPVHLDEEYAKGTFFKRRVAHGLLPLSFVGAIFGTTLPGPGSIYLTQSAEFKVPVFLGDTLTVRVEVTALADRVPKVTLRTTAVNQRGALVLEGEGVLLLKPPKGRG
jgi:3-hydroxybutyryl-CoA dehydratase